MCWCVFPIENASDASASQGNSARLRLISGATLAHCLLDHSECLLAGHQDRNAEAHHFYMERSSINGYIYIYIYIYIDYILIIYIYMCIIHQHWLIGIGICTCREIVQCLIPAPKLHLSIDDPRSCLLPQDSPTQKKVLVALTFHDHFKRDIVVTCFYDLPRCITYNTRIPWYIYIYTYYIYIYHIYIYMLYYIYIYSHCLVVKTHQNWWWGLSKTPIQNLRSLRALLSISKDCRNFAESCNRERTSRWMDSKHSLDRSGSGSFDTQKKNTPILAGSLWLTPSL